MNASLSDYCNLKWKIHFTSTRSFVSFKSFSFFHNAEYRRLIYYNASFKIPSTTFGDVWLTAGCDMQPPHTSLSTLSRRGEQSAPEQAEEGL